MAQATRRAEGRPAGFPRQPLLRLKPLPSETRTFPRNIACPPLLGDSAPSFHDTPAAVRVRPGE